MNLLIWLNLHVGRIAFAWWKGSALDCDSKRWRLFADGLNDAAICLEIMAPHFSAVVFPVLVCVTSVFRSIVGLVGGATRAALTQHQARRNNLADVSAKDGSQETLVNLFALCCNMFILNVVSGHPTLIWTVYALFTCVHLCANYMAVTSLKMDSINYERLSLLVDSYLDSDKKSVLSITEANELEPILLGLNPFRHRRVRLGTSVGTCVTAHNLASVVDQLRRSQHALVDHGDTVHVVVKSSARTEELLFAAFCGLCRVRGKGATWEEFVGLESALSAVGWRTEVCLLDWQQWRLRLS